MISTWFASKILAVSFKVSPLLRLEVAAEMLITSALNRKAASSNEVRVRVLGSTKKLTSVFPRNAGTFLISRVPTCLKASAVSRTRLISSTDNSRSPSKSLRFQRVVIADVGEHRLPACSWRRPAANLDWREQGKWVQMRSASCRTRQAGSLRSPEKAAGRARYPEFRAWAGKEFSPRSFLHQPNAFVRLLFAQPQPHSFIRRGR